MAEIIGKQFEAVETMIKNAMVEETKPNKTEGSNKKD
jgi:hypothetical protein